MKSFFAALVAILCAGMLCAQSHAEGPGCIFDRPSWNGLWQSWSGGDDAVRNLVDSLQTIIRAEETMIMEWESKMRERGRESIVPSTSPRVRPCSGRSDIHGNKTIWKKFERQGQGPFRDIAEYALPVVTFGGSSKGYYYISLGEGNSVTDCAFLSRNADKWRAVEYGVYPNGKPHYLSCTEDGRPAGISCVWDTEGNIYDTVVDGMPLGDARLYPGENLDMPPSSVAPGAKGKADIATCFIRLSCNGNLLEYPWQCVKSSLRNSEITITPPVIVGYEFERWSGDTTGTDQKASILMDTDKNVVAHYHSTPALEDQRLTEAILESVGKTDGALEWEDTLKVTDLKAADKSIRSVFGLNKCSNLKRLDLSGNRIENLDSLSPAYIAQIQTYSWERPQAHVPINELVCLLSNTRELEYLETLTINNSQCGSISGVSQFPSLREIHANENNITAITELPSSLEVLSLDNNQITDISASSLAAVKFLRFLSVKNNRISNLSRLAATDGIPEGLTIDLRDNPITLATVAENLAVLEGKGIHIKTSVEKAAMEENWQADPDQDGCSNRDELRFTSLFGAAPEEIWANYQKASQDPNIPSEYINFLQEQSPGQAPMTVDSIPYQEVGIEITGSGTVHPGSGRHRFAKYVISPGRTLDYNQIMLRAIPADGWMLDPLNNKGKNGKGMFDDQGCATINMKEPGHCFATFKKGIPVADMDLLSDFEAFLKANSLGNDFLEYDQDGGNNDRDNRIVLDSDGIPDAAQMKLLDTLLKSPDFEPTYSEISKAWRDNLVQIRRDLKDFQDVPGAINTLNAYLTMGTEGGRLLAKKLCERLFNVDIGLDKYSFTGETRFGDFGKLGYRSNHGGDLWAEVSQGKPRNRELMDAFAKRVIQDAKREY